jgi:hypothetical protein
LTLNEGVDKLLGYVGDMSSLLRKYTVLIGDKSRSSRARWDPLGLDITIVARTIIARTIVARTIVARAIVARAIVSHISDRSSLLRKHTILIGDKSRSNRAKWDPLGLDITIVARTIVARTIVSHVGSRSRHLGAEVVRFNHHRARVVDILRSRRRRIELARLLLLRVIRSRGGRL